VKTLISCESFGGSAAYWSQQTQALREQIGLVAQQGLLFNASVRDNIAYGRLESTLPEIEQAARLAAMAPNPRFYERNQGAPGLKRKIAIILARMPSAELP